LAKSAAALAIGSPIARVPPDAETKTTANWEGGQTESPIRPAAGVRARQARRLSWRLSQQLALRSKKREAKASDRGADVVQVELENPQPSSDAECRKVACQEPTPAAGRIGLPALPSSTLAGT
jgi:hypothetical protein